MSLAARKSPLLFWRHGKSTTLNALFTGVCVICAASIDTCIAQAPQQQRKSWTEELAADPPSTASAALEIPSSTRTNSRPQRAEPLLIHRTPKKRMKASSRSATLVRRIGVTQAKESEGVKEPTPPLPNPAATEKSAALERPDVTNQLSRMQQERDARYRRLMKQLQKVKDRNRLRALQNQMRQQQLTTNKPEVNPESKVEIKEAPDTSQTASEETPSSAIVPEEPVEPTKVQGDVPSVEIPSVPKPDEAEVSPTEGSPAPPSSDNPPPEPQTEAVDSSETEDSVFAEGLGAKKIVEGTVNRVGMADSLYRLEQLELALDTYTKIDRMELPMSERYWVVYQIACCHRRLGQTDKAQSLYRRLASDRLKSGWLGEMSRWWLDQIDSRQELITELEAQEEIIRQIQEIIAPAEDETDAEALPGI